MCERRCASSRTLARGATGRHQRYRLRGRAGKQVAGGGWCASGAQSDTRKSQAAEGRRHLSADENPSERSRSLSLFHQTATAHQSRSRRSFAYDDRRRLRAVLAGVGVRLSRRSATPQRHRAGFPPRSLACSRRSCSLTTSERSPARSNQADHHPAGSSPAGRRQCVRFRV